MRRVNTRRWLALLRSRDGGGVLTAIVPPLSPGYADFHLLRVANCEVAYAAYPNGGVIINVLLYKQKLRNG